MAGSFRHILNGWSMIENMGDAHEAVQELMYVILSEVGEKRANKILNKQFYPIIRGDVQPDKPFDKVQRLMNK